MIARAPRTYAALAAAAILAAGTAAHAGSTTYFSSGQTYTGLGSSPFAGTGNLIVESFDDGGVNSLMTAIGGSIKGPSSTTDSVDPGGSSYSTTGRSMTFKFDAQGGARPTMAGLAWTDGRPNAMVTFRAWDASGNLIGKFSGRVGDLLRTSSSGEDRFFGIASEDGIAKIRISSSKRGFEVDHVQFAYGFSVVPVPPALGLGLAGLAGIGLLRRFSRKRD